jgi:hypothetical protein
MRRKQPEAEIQRAVVQHLETRGVPGLVWFAVPNGGVRSKIEAAIMKGLGTKPGVSDLILLHESRFYALELKAPRQKPNKQQMDFLSSVHQQLGYAAWANSLDEALSILEHWDLLRGVVQTSLPSKQLNRTMKDGTKAQDHLS